MHIRTHARARARARTHARTHKEYVISKLAATNSFKISKQSFVVPVYRELTPPSLSFPNASPALGLHRCATRTGWQRYESGCDYAGVRYGGSGDYDFIASWQLINEPCNANSFAELAVGAVALVRTGGGCDDYRVHSLHGIGTPWHGIDTA